MVARTADPFLGVQPDPRGSIPGRLLRHPSVAGGCVSAFTDAFLRPLGGGFLDRLLRRPSSAAAFFITAGYPALFAASACFRVVFSPTLSLLQ